MSCNCSNNPCSCANANCGCPPDYSIDPATISCSNSSDCEDTLTTDCVFTTQYLTCAQLPIGISLSSTLAAMDAKICQCGSCSGQTSQSPNLLNLSNFYVDSLNTVLGNGSVINPFQTIDQAITKVIGTGTRSAPQFTNATVHVMAGQGYTTSQNIYIPSATFNFEAGTVVTFTGAGTYFVDSSAVADGANPFMIDGLLYWQTATGGFLKNQGSYGTGYNKRIIINASSINGTTPGASPTIIPLIDQHLTTSSNVGQPISTYITLHSASIDDRFLTSSIQNTINFLGGVLEIDLGGGQIGYGAFGATSGLSTGNVVKYNGQANNSNTSFILKNGRIWSVYNTDMISTQGYFNEIIIQDIRTESYVGTPTSFLNIGTMTLASAGTADDFTFLLDRVYLHPQAFVLGGVTAVIRYTGGGQFFDYLEMQNCILYYALFIGTNIRIGLIANGLFPVATYNVIKGNFNVKNLPTSSFGLVSGDVWNNSGILTIV